MTKRFELNPDLTCPELAGYKLTEVERREEDDVEGMAKEEFNNIDKPIRSGVDYHSYKVGFADGYTKAREKFEFSESQLRQAIEMARKSDSDYLPASDFVQNFYVNSPDSILSNLRTPRHPIAIEVEMVEITDWVETHRGMLITPIVCLKPAKNPDGTVKGTYIYE